MADDQVEVHVPEQVRRMAARAEELQKELVGLGEEAQPTEAVPSDTTVVPGGEPPPVAGDRPAAPSTEWEQRYRTLQGKYDSEVAGLRAQVASMERLIATMQTPPVPAPSQQPSGEMRFEDADVDTYGQDFLEAAARAAAARYEPVISQLQGQIRRLEGGQSKINNEQLQDRVFEALDRDPELAGRWQQINTSPAFIQWLQEIDEYSGVARNTMLQHAYVNGDVIRTGRFFKKYMAEHTAPNTSYPNPQTNYAPRPPGSNGLANGSYSAGGARLEDMVVPGRASNSGGSGNGAPQSRIWTRPEITRFYRERTQGKWKGREAESEALERDIHDASREGRIH